MDILTLTTLTICVIGLLFSLYMLVRNEWVARFRREEIDQDLADYMQLVDYDAMMLRFWCWDRNPSAWLKHR